MNIDSNPLQPSSLTLAPLSPIRVHLWLRCCGGLAKLDNQRPPGPPSDGLVPWRARTTG